MMDVLTLTSLLRTLWSFFAFLFTLLSTFAVLAYAAKITFKKVGPRMGTRIESMKGSDRAERRDGEDEGNRRRVCSIRVPLSFKPQWVSLVCFKIPYKQVISNGIHPCTRSTYSLTS